ncbi:MAG: glycosyltransferase, partial [Cyanobacteria bacterium J06632_19]
MNSSSKTELQTEMHKTNLELEQLKSQLQTAQTELAQARGIIAWMETSKFWKIRLKWLGLKQKLQGLFPKKFPKPIPNQPTIQTSVDCQIPQIDLPRFVPENPQVLLIVEETIPQCFRYRVQQKLEQLQALKWKVEVVSWRDAKTSRKMLHFCHAVIFYRVPAFEDVVQTIKYAKALKKVIFFDIDDLIFDLNYYPEPIESFGKQVSVEEYEGLVKGVALYREALALCDYAIASTPILAKEMAKVSLNKSSFCHRNAIDSQMLQFLRSPLPKLHRNYLSIFYGSGTKTHDADFQIAAPALAKILDKYQNVRLTIVGYLTLPKELIPYQERIDRIGLLRDIDAYWTFLAQADINIAPLKNSLFNDCKSEIKWLEAAALSVPSVVSYTQMYAEILQDGVDALIAHTAEDWFEKLDLLVGKEQVRQNIATQAKQKALEDYAPAVMADNLKQILHSGIKAAVASGEVIVSQPKKKLLFVNVLYPPQAIGGATSLLKNIVDGLQTKYSESYDISVFTYDLDNPQGYELSEYTHDGVHVTKLSLPPYPDLDWRYQDSRVYEIFSQYLSFAQPELIHFHCVQRLTASTLEAAADLNIPYVVTVHDAWWICDHQFMLDSQGLERDYHQIDPVVAARYTENIDISLERRRYLTKCLNGAEVLLAVSEFQAQLYAINGFSQIRVNRNGIIPQPVLPKKNGASNRIRWGYAGGICVHKG